MTPPKEISEESFRSLNQMTIQLLITTGIILVLFHLLVLVPLDQNALTFLKHQFDPVAKWATYIFPNPIAVYVRCFHFAILVFLIQQHMQSKFIQVVTGFSLISDFTIFIASLFWLASDRAPGIQLPFDEWFCFGSSLLFVLVQTAALYTLRQQVRFEDQVVQKKREKHLENAAVLKKHHS